MTANSAQGIRGHDSQLRCRFVAFLCFLKIDSLRKMLHSSLFEEVLWRSKLTRVMLSLAVRKVADTISSKLAA